jgi:N-acetylneuraminate synthase
MTLIIAEAGVNHNGQENLAIELINVAKSAGANIVKFQTFKAKYCISNTAEQADYQVLNTKIKESQLAMVQKLELSYEAHHRLIMHCNQIGIEFLSTAFDHESLDFLVNDLKLTRLKIPSGEITNAPLVLEHARTQCDLIVSTGMASLADIEKTLGVIAFGYTASIDRIPTEDAFIDAYFSVAGQKALREKVTILHCTTEYPAPLQDINLNAMDTINKAFKLPIGYSDHSEGIVVAIAAVAKGATIIEKHFTLDKLMEGPDHVASLSPFELKAMVEGIRAVELCLGDGLKGPRASEIKNMNIARKSIVAKKQICKGDKFSEENIIIKRPGTGMSPYKYWDLIKGVSDKNYVEDQLI